jgi:hypothetical protein
VIWLAETTTFPLAASDVSIVRNGYFR